MAADGKIYLMNQDGDVAVISAQEGQLLKVVAMAGPGEDAIRSSIIAAHGHLLMRTTEKLYCVGS